jgi:hypothetical protein
MLGHQGKMQEMGGDEDEVDLNDNFENNNLEANNLNDNFETNNNLEFKEGDEETFEEKDHDEEENHNDEEETEADDKIVAEEQYPEDGYIEGNLKVKP